MRPSTLAFGVLALFVLVPAFAAAQTNETTAPANPTPAKVIVNDGDVLITENETWNESRDVPGLLFIRGNASLTIDGVTVHVGGLGVEPQGRLVLRSEPGSPARLASSNATGWRGIVAGDLEVDGRPDAPVTIDGVGGTSSRPSADSAVVFQGGFYLSGNGTVSSVVFSNYTSGLYVSHAGHLDANDITFRSGLGLGLVVSDGRANVTDARFEGRGASVVVARLGRISLIGATFDSPDTAIVTSAITSELRNIRVVNATVCLEDYAGTVTVDGFLCREFHREGIHAVLARPYRYATLDLRHADIASSNATPGQGHGIDIDGLTSANVTNATIGPVPGNGIIEQSIAPRIEGLVIRGAALFGEVLVDPPTGYSMSPHYNGTSGGNGWLEAKWTMTPTVLLANGTAAPNATVAYYAALESKTPLKAQTVNSPANESGPQLMGIVVIPNGSRIQMKYIVHAKSEDGNETATVALLPNGNSFTVQLAPAPEIKHQTPGAGLSSLLAATTVGAIIVAWARRRR